MNIRIKFNYKKRNNFYRYYVTAYAGENIICDYIVDTENKCTSQGMELLKGTLLSWATLDFCFIKNIDIVSSIDKFTLEYIKDMYYLATKTYQKMYSKSIAKVNVEKKYVLQGDFEEIVLDKNKFLLGYSGGKDSSLVKRILELSNKKFDTYKVSYDEDDSSRFGHIYQNIYNNNLYMYSLSMIKNTSDIFNVQQADDIHTTYIMPFLSANNKVPGNLVVGIPWEALHVDKNLNPDMVPTETYYATKILRNFFNNINIKNFNVYSPISVFHTAGVYNILSQIIGFNNLIELDSCWDFNYQGACGSCLKCQKIKMIYKKYFDYDYLEWTPRLDFLPSVFLYSSFADEYLNVYKIDKFNSLLLDDESIDFCGPFLDFIRNYFSFNEIYLPKLSFDFSKCLKWSEVQKNIVMAINISYDKLSDTKINKFKSIPYLPFEKDYNWKRKNPILNCYNYIPYFDGFGQQHYIDIRKDDNDKIMKLVIPKSSLFKKFFQEDKVRRWYCEDSNKNY